MSEPVSQTNDTEKCSHSEDQFVQRSKNEVCAKSTISKTESLPHSSFEDLKDAEEKQRKSDLQKPQLIRAYSAPNPKREIDEKLNQEREDSNSNSHGSSEGSGSLWSGWRFGFPSFMSSGDRRRSNSHSHVNSTSEDQELLGVRVDGLRTPLSARSARSILTPALKKISSEPTERNERSSSLKKGRQFEKRVSFDTFSNKQASDYVLTLRAQHINYVWSKNSRTFLCGLDRTDYSENALDWLMEMLVEDGDEVIALRVTDTSSGGSFSYSGSGNNTSSFSTSNGSSYATPGPLRIGIRPSSMSLPEMSSPYSGSNSLSSGERASDYILEAEAILQDIIRKNVEQKAISIVVEFALGKIQDFVEKMIYTYSPDSLIVGTKGKSSGFQSLRSGSVSKYCLQHSPVPVIVVRPDRKRLKAKSKRLADPARRSYIDMIEEANKQTHGRPGLTI